MEGVGVDGWRRVRREERDQGLSGGTTSSERERLRELERENRELKRSNEILRKASAYFAQAKLFMCSGPVNVCTDVWLGGE